MRELHRRDEKGELTPAYKLLHAAEVHDVKRKLLRQFPNPESRRDEAEAFKELIKCAQYFLESVSSPSPSPPKEFWPAPTQQS